MQIVTRTHAPKDWLEQIFSAKAAAHGGVIRRKASWVAQEVGRARFEAEVRRRGYHLIETGADLVVICHSGPVRLLF